MGKALPTKEHAAAFALDHLKEIAGLSIEIREGSTDDDREGYAREHCDDCWIIRYSFANQVGGAKTLYVSKQTGKIVKEVSKE